MTCSLCVAFMSSDFTYLAVMAMAATFHCSLTCWPLSHSGHASKVTLIAAYRITIGSMLLEIILLLVHYILL